ncbi:ATP-binding protein [Tenuibacillus multivorans]|uniref:histidine kinase n=1 Tax=Tenuibacillus multivorans TaxID=237069 RepID=A0A1G9WMX0_9BACI|nr:sensor histidine kinase [Tenuibacillus multivorans]GEL78007.1 ATPase [Tenuibacillus multivorans]SDM85697.1 two-component system, CitB family, sensor histidine kinase CitS [Tenuibacillus multivorans]
MQKFSLRTKILSLFISILLFVTLMITGIYSYVEWNQTKDSIGQRALDVATSISLMPEVIDAFELEEPSEVIQPIAESIRERVGAEFIVVGNQDSIRYSHPQEFKIGRTMVGGDNDQALVHGQYYKSEAVGSLGPSLRGKAPIINDQGEIIGIVSVGFMLDDIRGMVYDRLIVIFITALVVLGLGIVGGVFLTRSIRRDILGLEPHEIVSFYRERKAVLRSIKEGIIAIDQDGKITILNHSAREMLGLTEDAKFKPIDEVLPNTNMKQVLENGEPNVDDEIILKDRVVIVNRTPIYENGEVAGVVASFRDKTEIQEMLNTLSEVKSYSEDLRAQTHEYTNKLYVISGLLQLGHYDEAIRLIQEESNQHNYQTKTLFSHIEDQTIQAILLGKIGKASEKKVELNIDENSSLSPLPKHINTSKMITILGNLLDNAIEAASESDNNEVTFFATDLGNDIILEVSDQGTGIPKELQRHIFEKGFSTKDEDDRGYGLSIVDEVVNELSGTIEVQSEVGKGTVFTVYLPKRMNEGE